MPRLSKKNLFASSLIMPFTLAALTIAAPRAIAAQSDYEALEPGERKVSALEHALFMAASEKRLEEARMLMETGTSPNFEVPGDGTPLIRAAVNGDLDMAALLLSHNAEIDAYSNADESALINAARSDQLAMVDYLVQSGADVSLGRVVNQISRPEWRSPLSEAKKYGHVEIIKYLQSAGAVEDSRMGQKPAGTIVEGRLSSPFGVVRKQYGKHKGLDIAAKSGTPIFAPADGTVLEVTNSYQGNPNWGHVVVIESAGGIKTLFAHLKDSQVQVGEAISAGAKIARVGNTGKSTGPHVHIQTFVNDKLVDPTNVWPSLAR